MWIELWGVIKKDFWNGCSEIEVQMHYLYEKTSSSWHVRLKFYIAYREEKLEEFEEQKCRDLVKELYDELMKDFFEYIIPSKFFGPY